MLTKRESTKQSSKVVLKGERSIVNDGKMRLKRVAISRRKSEKATFPS